MHLRRLAPPLAALAVAAQAGADAGATGPDGGAADGSLALPEPAAAIALPVPDAGIESTAARAPPAPMPSAVALRPLAVTPTRREAQVFESPRAVTAIDSTDAARRAVRSLSDLLAYEPGVFIHRSQVGSGAPILRGLGGPRTLVLVDGIRVNHSLTAGGPGPDLAVLDVAAPARVEVLRGPGAVLYGPDAVAGVVQVLTPEPKRYEPGVAHAKGGAMGRVASAEASDAGRVWLSLGAAGIGLNAGATARDAGDLRAGGGAAVPRTAFDEGFADVKLSARAGPGILTGMYQRARLYELDGTDAAGFGILTRIDRARDLAYLAYDVALPFADRARLTLSFHRQVEDRHRERFSGGAVELAAASLASLESDALETDNVHTIGGALAMSSALASGRLMLSYGADYYRDRVASLREERPGGARAYVPATRGAVSDGSRYTLAGLYLFAEWAAAQSEAGAFTLFAGARGSDARAFAPAVPMPDRAQPPCAAADAGPNDVCFVHDTLSFAAGGSILLSDAAFAAVSVHHAARPPNLAETTWRGDAGRVFELPNPELRPERATSYEVVLRLARGLAALELSAYYITLAAPIVAEPADDGGATEVGGLPVVRRVNGGRACYVGIEASARTALGARVEAYGQIAFTWGDQPCGERPASRVPPPNGLFGLRFHAKRERPTLALDAVVRGAVDQRRVSPEDARDPTLGERGSPGWYALDARLYSEVTESIRFTAAVENLLDRPYRPHGSAAPASGFNALGQAEVRF